MKKKLFNKIFITAYVCSILCGADVKADEITDENKEGNSLTFESTSQDIKQYLKDKGKVLFISGLMKNRIMVWSGFHNYLYGYEDQRYVSTDSRREDQGDYIKTDSQYYGIELLFSDMTPEFRDVRFGLNICVLRHGDISSRELYAVPGHGIPQETIAGDMYDYDTNEKWWTNAGIFIGLDKKWYAVDLGLTLKATIIDENEREKLAPSSDSSNPVYTRGKGRGLMFDESGVSPNLFIRFGLEEKPNITFSVLRDDYDPVYGIAVVKVRFPLVSFCTINVGGYLHQTEALFIEPIFSVGKFSIGARAGLIVNYNDDYFERAGLSDSAFYSFSLAYKW